MLIGAEHEQQIIFEINEFSGKKAARPRKGN